MSEHDKENGILVAGQITGMIYRYTAKEWDEIAATSALYPHYAENIRRIAEFRRSLDGAQERLRTVGKLML